MAVMLVHRYLEQLVRRRAGDLDDRARACSADELRALFLFEKLTDDQLDWLCRERPRWSTFEPGPVYAEGDAGHLLLRAARGHGGAVPPGRRRRRRGQPDLAAAACTRAPCSAYLGDRVPQVYNSSMRVTEPSRFFVLRRRHVLRDVMQEWFPMAVHLLEGLFFGHHRTRSEAVGQRERLLALGSLSAGLTHELNNPAAAAVRATAALRERVAGMRHKLAAHRRRPPRRGDALQTLIKFQERGRRAGRQGADADPLEAVRPRGRAHRLARRPRHRGRLASSRRPSCRPASTATGWTRSPRAVDRTSCEGAIRWLNYTVETELLMNEIEDSTTRISTLVDAAKQYSQLDRAPYQIVDVHELLDSTLMMLAAQDRPGITRRQGLRPRRCRRSRRTPPSSTRCGPT